MEGMIVRSRLIGSGGDLIYDHSERWVKGFIWSIGVASTLGWFDTLYYIKPLTIEEELDSIVVLGWVIEEFIVIYIMLLLS